VGEEVDLLRLSVAGDGDAFGRLIGPHLDVLRRVAYLHAPSADVDDVVQDALGKAWTQLSTLRAGAGLCSWLVSVVANTARNQSRGAGRRATWELRAVLRSEATSVRTPEDAAISGEQAHHVLTAVSCLPDEQRDVVTYRYFLDLSVSETADALQIPVGTAKSRLSRALTRLRSELEEGEP
jgi:RNA polymerase sigma-70 factor (ECF subfamily)